MALENLRGTLDEAQAVMEEQTMQPPDPKRKMR